MLFVVVLFSFISYCVGYNLPVASEYEQDWGYVSVRPGAKIFYWTYLAENYQNKPLILWLQGGPSTPASGVGNFKEIGPYDVKGRAKEYSWIHNATLLFVDSPVGTGFSYCETGSHLARNSSEVAQDLLSFLEAFYIKISKLHKSPLYIFGENYGGKTAVDLAVLIKKEYHHNKKPFFDLAGIALGGAWISPVEATEAYGRFLYSNSLIDSEGYIPIGTLADRIRIAVSKNEGRKATLLWTKLIKMISDKTNGVNFLNILSTKNSFYSNNDLINLSELGFVVGQHHDALWKFMNTEVKQKLRLPINVTWNAFNQSVFNALYDDFMKSSVKSVEILLNTTRISVLIYNGQLDLFMPSVAAESWITEMNWLGVPGWMKSKRTPILLGDTPGTVGFKKSHKTLTLKWILRAGNMVPKDASHSAFYMMKEFLGVKVK